MWKRLKLKYGLNAHRSTMIRFIWIADQNGMEKRKSMRLLRRKYSCSCPNSVCHIDGYDKLKHFGFAIHGARYSRKIRWLEVGTSNNDRLIQWWKYFSKTVFALLYSSNLNRRGCLPEFMKLFDLITSSEREVWGSEDAFNPYMYISS
jgi:hypothetical protein